MNKTRTTNQKKTKTETKALLKEVEDYCAQLQIIDKPILIACSGGLDSTALLHCFTLFYPKELITCIHLDHGWHQDSTAAIQVLNDFCKSNDIRLISKSIPLGEMSQDENSARKARYDFFTETAIEHKTNNIFLAHNLNDHIETVVFRMLRGTSTDGLRGIPVRRKLNSSITIHRPLIKINRETILNFSKEHHLSYIEDPSNSDIKYSRNMIRHKILPEAYKINPQTINNIDCLAEIVKEEQDFLSKKTQRALEQLGPMPWSLSSFREIDKAIQRKILESQFTTNIRFCNEFLEAITAGGFHKINFEKNKFFVIRQKQINLETQS